MKDELIRKIDRANILLMVLSLAVAYILPFKLFLFSYAILGPLHYLTEIHWLNEKHFFVKNQDSAHELFLYSSISITAIILIHNALSASLQFEFFSYFSFHLLMITSIFFAGSLLFISRTHHIFLSLIICYAIAIIIKIVLPKWLILFGLFLPTIIHVFLFTFLFMLYGAKKSKSTTGYLAAILLLTSPIAIFLLPINSSFYHVSIEISDSLKNIGMSEINRLITKGLGFFSSRDIDQVAEAGIKIQIFISFAYTYHYLNWFSKTSVIGWKESMSSKRKRWVLIIWLIAISIYTIDFQTGYFAILFLSTLHVILEFPLNVQTIKHFTPKTI